MDITRAFDQIFNLIFNGFSFCYNTLDSLTYHGISLLDFFIWIFVLGIIIPLIITVLPSWSINTYSEIRPASRAQRAIKKGKKDLESAFDVDLDWDI